jgi:hypothetical protein
MRHASRAFTRDTRETVCFYSKMVRSVLKITLIGACYILLERYKLVEHDYVMILRQYTLYMIINA